VDAYVECEVAVSLIAPFPYFGGKRSVAADVWRRLGEPKQYIEPFCGSLAILLAKRKPASLEVVGDANGFIANFWRAVKHDPAAVATSADYPVSHVDLGARHKWLMGQRERLAAELHDCHWPGDAKVAGWWLWGQCCWIGSGWCDWGKGDAGRGIQAAGQIPHVGNAGRGIQAAGQIPHVSDAGRGIQAAGQIPHVSDAGRGIQAAGKIPHVSDAGRGIQAAGKIPHVSSAGMGDLLTTGGMAAWDWLHKIATRLDRVRVIHGDWSRCLNCHYGGAETAIFFDPPYLAFEGLYGVDGPVAAQVAAWAAENAHLRIAICGHRGDYDLPGWDPVDWDRGRLTYGSDKTTAQECIWYSPACHPATLKQEAFL
jgi:hypothetical protein